MASYFWPPIAGTTSGTVTSVGLADGSSTPIYTISGSPVTSSGTLTFSLATQTANKIFAGPTTGAAAQPTFRTQVLADFPAIASQTVLANATGGSAVPTAVALGTVTEATSSVLTLTGFSNATIGSPTIQVKQSSTSVSGYLSNTDWNTFNGKQAALTIGNLTDVGTDGIVVTGGTGAVIGSGTSIAQHVADSTHNGYLSSTDWSTFNAKQAALTIGDLTDVGTDGIVITSGTGAVIGSGTSIAQHVADSTHNGYLSSTDWSTFNGKQAALTIGNLTDAGTDGIVVTGGTGAVIGSGTSIAQRVADSTHNGYLSSADWSTFNGKGSGSVTSVGLSVPATSILGVTGTPVTVSGTLGLTTTGTSGGIPYFSSTSQLASSAALTASQLIVGGGAATTPATLAAGSQFQVLVMGASNPGYGQLNLSQSAAVTGTLLAAQEPAHTGDVTNSAGSLALTIANSAVTNAKMANMANNTIKGNNTTAGAPLDLTVAQTVAMFSPPTAQKFTSGSGTYNLSYWITCTSANATVAATYTNNGVTFTVQATIASGTSLWVTGNGAPSAGGTLTKASGTGDSTITFAYFTAPKYIKVKMVGGGGGGAGGGTTQPAGGSGGNTTFGSSLLVANGGSPGSGVTAGAGGSASLGTGPLGLALTGGTGDSGFSNGTNTTNAKGAYGGNSAFGGAGSGGCAAAGTAGATNTGGGGGGGAGANANNNNGGGGGGAGGYVDSIITSPSATYSYAVGAAGTLGSAGTSGNAGAAGGSGVIYVEEYYQ